jgi:hypothetical protein
MHLQDRQIGSEPGETSHREVQKPGAASGRAMLAMYLVRQVVLDPSDPDSLSG